jgi:hypothetical protein
LKQGLAACERLRPEGKDRHPPLGPSILEAEVNPGSVATIVLDLMIDIIRNEIVLIPGGLKLN